MREYCKVSPQFWTGATGKEIRKTGRDAQLVALYLLTCPNSNWIGLYYMPLPTLCHETGLKPEGAWKALRSLSEAQFAYFDDASEHVFVVEEDEGREGSTVMATTHSNGRAGSWDAPG